MAKLTKSVLNDLMTGISSIKLLGPLSTLPTESAALKTLFDEADEIFTTKDSVSIEQAEPSTTELKVDQFDAAIGVTYEPGEYTFACTIPSNAKPLLDYFFATNDTPAPAVPGYAAGVGVEAKTKIVKTAMFIESQSKNSAILFMNTELVATTTWSDTSTTPLSIRITGTIKSNPDGDDIIFYPTAASSASPALSTPKSGSSGL